jgi:PAS domain S-box-containing protein
MVSPAHRSTEEASEQFRLLVEAVEDYAIFMLDPEGRVTTWNAGAERIKQYSAAEVLGQHFSIFYTHEDRAAAKPEHSLEKATQLGRYEQEGWRLRKDGTRFWANVTLTAIRNRDGQLLGFAKITRDVSERKRMEKQLHDSEKSLRDLSLHLLRTQDDERRRIGRDLHDSLGQYLAALKMKLDMVARRHGADKDLVESIALVEDSIKEVRTLAYLLHPPLLEETGLQSAIQWYLDGFQARSDIKITFERDPDFPRLSREVELAMFRVLQESLTNVHRHSGSAVAHICLFVENDHAVLEVQDEGHGMDPSLLPESALSAAPLGIGLRGMIERMKQLDGRLEVTTGPKGTCIRATAPLTHKGRKRLA